MPLVTYYYREAATDSYGTSNYANASAVSGGALQVGELANIDGNLYVFPTASPKVGAAQLGLTPNDFWNSYTGDLTKYSSSPSTSAFVYSSLPGGSSRVSNSIPGHPDPMFATYLSQYNSSLSGEAYNLQITSLPAGTYTLVVYGHGANVADTASFSVTIGISTTGVQSTTSNSSWLSNNWTLGVHYVQFTGLVIGAGQTMQLNVLLNGVGVPIFNGLQLLRTA